MVITGVIPRDGAENVPIDTVIQLTFSSTLDPATAFNRFVTLLQEQAPVQCSFRVDGKVLYVTPAKLEYGKRYTLYVYNRNIITNEYFRAADSTTLDRMYVFSFSTALLSPDSPAYELPIYSSPISIQLTAELVDDGELVLYLPNSTFVLKFSDIVTSAQVEQYYETLDGRIVELTPTVSVQNNSLLVSLAELEPNCLVTVVLKQVQFAHSQAVYNLTLYKYTWLQPNFGSLHSLKMLFNRFAKYLTDAEIIGYVLKQQQAYEELSQTTVLGLTQIDPAKRSLILKLARFMIIEDLLLDKGIRQSDQLQYGEMQVRYGDVDTKLLDYLQKQKDELERELVYARIGPDVAVAGLMADNWLKTVRYHRFQKGDDTWKS